MSFGSLVHTGEWYHTCQTCGEASLAEYVAVRTWNEEYIRVIASASLCCIFRGSVDVSHYIAK